MGLEYIVQPQVFLGGLTALGPGIQGLTEQYPLLTTYYSWTSTASVNTSSFPIPIAVGSIYNGPGKEASFIISVGGVIQSPTEYTVDSILRTITFSSVVSAGIELAATQLATAAPSSQNFNFLKSVSAEFTTLSTINGSFNNLVVTNLTALSTVVNVIDIQVSEVSGFRATGDVEVLGNINVTNNINLTGNLVAEDITSTNATFTNLTATDFTTSNLTISNPVNSLTVTDLTVTNSTAVDLTATNSTITNLMVTDLTATNTAVVTNLTAANAFITGLSGTIHNYNLQTYASTTDADQTMDANVASRGSWIANFTANRTLDILNLTEGREVFVYVRNTNATARTITVRASTTTTGATTVNFAREGAVSVTGISLAISSGTAVFWVANINGTFVGSI